MHAVRSDTINTPIGEELLKWGKDPMTGRLYVLTEGEPATIECYRDGFLPKLCLYPGSYNHATGIIDSDREEVDIFLESIPEPVTSRLTQGHDEAGRRQDVLSLRPDGGGHRRTQNL